MSAQPELEELKTEEQEQNTAEQDHTAEQQQDTTSKPVLSEPFAPGTAGTTAASEVDYRSLHTPALVSVVLGAASLISLLMSTTSIDATLVMSTIPLVGLIVGVRAWLAIRREPEVWTGLRFAVAGTFLSAFFLIVSPMAAMYVYATEVPDGYQRLTFTEMKPDEKEEARHIFIPPEVLALDGKRVFIKGYMRPGAQSYGLDNFLLVRDNNQCCFGELSEVKYYDQVQVEMQGDRRADYSRGIFRMGGILKVDPTANPNSGQPTFILLADYLR